MDAAPGKVASRFLIETSAESKSAEIQQRATTPENGSCRPDRCRDQNCRVPEDYLSGMMSSVPNVCGEGEESHTTHSVLNPFFLAAVSNLSGVFRKL